MSLVDDLKAVREWLTPMEHWTKYDYAKRTKRSTVIISPRDPNVGCTCLVGAAQKIAAEDKGQAYYRRCNVIVDAIADCVPTGFFRSVTAFNDHSRTTLKKVHEVLDCAIDKAEASS